MVDSNYSNIDSCDAIVSHVTVLWLLASPIRIIWQFKVNPKNIGLMALGMRKSLYRIVYVMLVKINKNKRLNVALLFPQ